jgi:8-amino-7-oxononanoate synthase
MYEFYEKELEALTKVGRLRKRVLFNESVIDLASNDYLGLSSNKKALKKTYKKLYRSKEHSPKASMLVNGYHPIHRKLETTLAKANKFENGIVLGSGFLANLALIESLVRKKDILLMDEEYHASGVIATKLLNDSNIVFFKHNDTQDLEKKIQNLQGYERLIIAIEGVYSMGGDIAKEEFYDIANQYHAILIVDEAHSCGTIGKNLLGWFDHFSLPIKANHIKMGTLGKAYGSYGAYILGSNHIIKYLQNRAKSIIYTTAPSLFDIALAYENFKLIQKRKKRLRKKILRRQQLIKKHLDIDTSSMIIPIVINDNRKVLDIQNKLLKNGYLVGAIRQPTVKQAIIRLILRTNNTNFHLKKVLKLIKEYI